MNTRLIIAGFITASLIASLAVAAFSKRASAPPKPDTYAVKGRIIEIDPAEKSLRIHHEEIPDYMPEMTMPFAVQDAALLNGVKPGDSISFRLSVTDDDSWIDHIKIISSTETDETVRAARELSSPELNRLEIGEIVPDFSLTDQNGRPFQLASQKQKAVILTFIYTRCPIPNFCPLLSNNFKELQKRLSKEFPGRFQLLSISIDPKFDTPQTLKSYGARYDADESTWTMATGTPEEINRIGEWFGLTHEATGGLVNHDLRTALISPDGKLLQVWKSNVWTPYEIQRSVRQALTGSIDLARK